MDDLRWVLMLVGALVIAAVYFSSRFEREDWTREREQRQANATRRKKPKGNAKPKRVIKKEPTVSSLSQAPMPGVLKPEASNSRQEPQMADLEITAGISNPSEVKEKQPDVSLSNDSNLSYAPPSAFSYTPSQECHQVTESVQEVNARDESEPTLYAEPKPEQVSEKQHETIVANELASPALEPEQTSEQEAVPDSQAKTENEDDTEKLVADQPVEEGEIDTNVESTHVDSTNVDSTENPDIPESEVKETASEIPATELLTEEVVSDMGDLSVASKNSKSNSLSAAEIEDEITVIDISIELEEVEAQLKAEKMATELSGVAAINSEPILDIEPLVLVISVMADDEPFTGALLQEAFNAEALIHGDMSIFHYLVSGKSESVFSVASLVEPGYFDLDAIEEIETPGLTLFCQLPGPLSGEEAFDIMLDKGRGLAVRLNGQMCDDKHNVFTSQAKSYYLDKIATYNRELELARKKAGV